MKKQIMLLAIISLTALEVSAVRNVSSGSVNPASQQGSGKKSVSGGGSEKTIVQGAVVSQQQMQAAVAANPADALAAVQAAVEALSSTLSGGNAESSNGKAVASYIAG